VTGSDRTVATSAPPVRTVVGGDDRETYNTVAEIATMSAANRNHRATLVMWLTERPMDWPVRIAQYG